MKRTFWAFSLINLAKTFSSHASIEKYLPNICFIDYELDIYGNNQENEWKTDQLGDEMNKKENIFFISQHTPIISLNNNQSKNKVKQYITFDFKEKVCHTEENELETRHFLSSDLKNKNFLKNNTLINQLKLIDNFECNNKLNLKVLDNKKFLEHYKRVTNQIECDLKKKEHPLHKCIEKFINEFENFKNSQLTTLIDNLQQFIRVFSETLILFYQLRNYKQHLSNSFYFSKENILGFVTSIFFNRNEIYSILLEKQKTKDEQFEQKLQTNIAYFSKRKIEEFGISKKYTLSSLTIRLLRLHNTTHNKNTEVKKSNFDLKIGRSKSACLNYRKEMEKSIFSLSEPSTNEINGDQRRKITLDEFINYSVYEKAIMKLESIENFRSPIHKLKIIHETYLNILDNIHEFYSKYNFKFNNTIDSDDIIGIFMFICTRIKTKYLFSHCNLIEKFITDEVANSITGYYLITLKSSLICLNERTYLLEEE